MSAKGRFQPGRCEWKRTFGSRPIPVGLRPIAGTRKRTFVRRDELCPATTHTCLRY